MATEGGILFPPHHYIYLTLEKLSRIVLIDESGKLNLRLYKAEGETEVIILANGQRITGRVLATFKVSRKVLIDNSNQFKAMCGGDFAEARQTTVDVEEGTVTGLELWFRILHDTLTEEMFAIPIEEIWEALEIAGYREFRIEELKDWFATWVDRKT
jgi:hypothetical protein